MYGNRTHWELCSNPPLVLKTRADTSRADTPQGCGEVTLAATRRTGSLWKTRHAETSSSSHPVRQNSVAERCWPPFLCHLVSHRREILGRPIDDEPALAEMTHDQIAGRLVLIPASGRHCPVVPGVRLQVQEGVAEILDREPFGRLAGFPPSMQASSCFSSRARAASGSDHRAELVPCPSGIEGLINPSKDQTYTTTVQRQMKG